MEHINVHLMLHVQTQLDHTLVSVKMATQEMEELVSEINVLLDYIHVHLMPHVPTPLTYTSVYAILVFWKWKKLQGHQ